MATEDGKFDSRPSASLIGKTFVEQYYTIIHHFPDMAQKFYKDASILTHPDPDGTMSSVTTMEGINEKILSLKYEECNFEIETVDAQNSMNDCVIVLVTGSLTGQTKIVQKFCQTFCLAPQENGGFYVLNDILKLSSRSQVQGDSNLHENTSSDPVSPSHSCQDLEVNAESSKQDDDPTVNKSLENFEEDGSQKSYVSNDNVSNKSKYVGNVLPIKSKVEPFSTEKLARPPPETAESPSANNSENEEKRHTIYAGNIPRHATLAEVENLFKKFGPIRQGGVQMKVNKRDNYCFCFVEFESASSVQAAVEAMPLELAGHRITVQIQKRSKKRRDGGEGRVSGIGWQLPQYGIPYGVYGYRPMYRR
ncbi:nuclear transport factor 2-like [Wolffia australiana]